MDTIVQYLSFILIISLIAGCSSYEYLGQKPPNDNPEIFAPGVISLPDRKEEVITFSPDLKEIYYSIEYCPDPKPSFIMFTKFKNGKWSKPDTVNFSKGRRTSEPFIAFGGDRIYYFANEVKNQKGLLDICYSNRIKDSWSEPISLSTPPNFSKPNFTLHPCIIADSTIYFSSYSGDICRSNYKNGNYEKVEVLKSPINNMNLEQVECWGDPFVDQDESLMIFRSNREGGYGGSDLYIVFKKQNGNW